MWLSGSASGPGRAPPTTESSLWGLLSWSCRVSMLAGVIALALWMVLLVQSALYPEAVVMAQPSACLSLEVVLAAYALGSKMVHEVEESLVANALLQVVEQHGTLVVKRVKGTIGLAVQAPYWASCACPLAVSLYIVIEDGRPQVLLYGAQRTVLGKALVEPVFPLVSGCR